MSPSARNAISCGAVVGAMELNHVEVLQKRSEELGHDKDHHEKYDFAFARALSSLSTLIEYGLPFLKVGGMLVAHRGRTAADEASRVNVALEELGGEIVGHPAIMRFRISAARAR